VQQQSAELQSIEQRLQTRLGTRVHIHARARGGRIVLDYFSPEQFDHLIEVLSRA
jgi:ParB family chromosome partitioning protein